MRLETKAAGAACALALLAVQAAGAWSQEAKQDEEEPRPVFHQAGTLLGARITGVDGTVIGQIEDLVIGREYGGVWYAVVRTVEPKPGLLPFHELTWDAKAKSFSAGITREKLDTLPLFDRSRLQEMEPPPGFERPLGAPREAGFGRQQGETDSGQAEKKPVRCLLAQALMSAPVSTGADPFGVVIDLICEETVGGVAFVLVRSPSGEERDLFVVPWGAWKLAEGKSLHLPMNGEELRAAPTLARGKLAKLDEESFRARVYEHFGQPARTFVTEKKAMKREGVR